MTSNPVIEGNGSGPGSPVQPDAAAEVQPDVVADPKLTAADLEASRRQAVEGLSSLIKAVGELSKVADTILKAFPWTGDLIGVTAAALIVFIVGAQEFENRLSSGEFTTALVVCASLAFAGVVVAVFARWAASRGAQRVTEHVAAAATAGAEAQASIAQIEYMEYDRRLADQRAAQPQGDER